MANSDSFNPARGTENQPCAVCGSERFSLLYKNVPDFEYQLPGNFFIAQCRNCGLLMQNPRPAFTEILRYYTEAYAPFNTVGSVLIRSLRKRFLEKPRLRKYVAIAGQGSRVLDVGCSTGNLLIQLRSLNRFELHGVEPVVHAARIAQREGLNVFAGKLENAGYPNDFFDLIIMNHVLEHLPNPIEVLSAVWKILKHGGALMGELPCADCLERKIFGRYWQGYHLPRHLVWFTRPLLRRFLETQGFQIQYVRPQPQFSNWQHSLRNYLMHKGIRFEKLTLISGHHPAVQVASVPIILLARFLGYSAIQSFSARKL